MNLQWIEWFGSITGIAGAIWLSLNIPSSKWAYPIFLMSSAGLMLWAYRPGYTGIFWQQFVFTMINLIGLYRWLLQPALADKRPCGHSQF